MKMVHIKNGVKAKDGDKISMNVDCSQKQISFSINGIDQGVACTIKVGPIHGLAYSSNYIENGVTFTDLIMCD